MIDICCVKYFRTVVHEQAAWFSRKVFIKSTIFFILTHPVPIPDEKKNLSQIFIFTLCGASKAFIKPFEAPQKSVKMKI